jgi:hypothetical protein
MFNKEMIVHYNHLLRKKAVQFQGHLTNVANGGNGPFHKLAA